MPNKPAGDISDLDNRTPFVAPHSIDVKTIYLAPAVYYQQIGIYGTSRYGRPVYGFQPGIYGTDKYGESTYI